MLLQTSNAFPPMHFVPLAIALMHLYFISQTTKGCYCQQMGGGGVSPGRSDAKHATKVTQPMKECVVYSSVPQNDMV